jgi:ATP-dependent exoDNAse (exonuclease V) alpha subunit
VADVEPEEGELSVSFDGRSVTYGFGELDALVPAYAASAYKSQGSEYPAVVIPVMTQRYAMLQHNLLYTGVTRGKRLVVLVGQRNAVISRCATFRAGGAMRTFAPACPRRSFAFHVSKKILRIGNIVTNRWFGFAAKAGKNLA